MAKATPIGFEQNRFLALDGLRGIAALGVLAFHVVVVTRFAHLDSFYLFVDFFFVLSGFVLLPSMPQNVRELPRVGATFVVKRIFRFWPMLIAVLLVLWFLYAKERRLGDPNFSEEAFIQSILLLQIWFSATIAMNWPLWSLSAEWFANLAFTPLTAFKNLGIWLGVILGYVALWYGLNTDQEFIGNSKNLGSGPIREWEALGRAVLGMGLGLLLRRNLATLAKFRNVWLFLGSLVLAVALFASHHELQGVQVYWTTYIAGPVFALVVLQASQFNLDSKKLFGKLLAFLGKMSFGIYAFHVVVSLTYDNYVAKPFGREQAGPEWAEYLVTKIFAVAAISFLIAILVNWIFERPLQFVGKKLVARMNRRA